MCSLIEACREAVQLSSGQVSSAAAESELSQKKAKTAVNEPSILSHFQVLERQDSVGSNTSSDTAEREHSRTLLQKSTVIWILKSPTPTNCNIMRMLLTINVSLISRLDCLSDKVEQLQGEVFDLQEENKKPSKEIEESRKREADMKGLIDEANFSKEIEAVSYTHLTLPTTAEV